MSDTDDAWAWREHQGAVWAAGVAAVLLAVLVFAVVRTSTDAVRPGGVTTPAGSSSDRTATSPTTASPTTSYTMPNVQTSQADVLPPAGVPAPPSTDRAPDGEVSPPAETTSADPYAPSTTSGSAGAV
ncbi:hypothetical protein MARA_35160 [Mycolicibacterium arabiense]|uniref:Uncharacterized protein n=1 Tax=Mycolicibacterium arabiense TaxID=1286181 RepID=A0A7I7RZI0_9MYCO|nr:hypothetical protein [Mycolicibacterium arabiense]MCV7371347.1 hypothetical protein [Mycolicibacterium arabiense]BBY50048.1 hypothetical protein MARA_35160 [Mycolicibacterium arabiense]